jgi:hypothetical protein
MKHVYRHAVSRERRRKQAGLEAVEFGLFFVMMLPAFIWMFTSGMNFIRQNKANDVARAVALMYIKGVDFTPADNKKIVERLATGLNLVATGGTPAAPTNDFASGDGLLILSQVRRIGPTVCPTGCTNLNTNVYLERVYIGNRTLTVNGVSAASGFGTPPDASLNTTGATINPTGDTTVRTNGAFDSLWNGALADGQIVYMVEVFFRAPGGAQASEFTWGGVYTRVFM